VGKAVSSCDKNQKLNHVTKHVLNWLHAFIVRVHNMFGGMRDLANFCGDIRDGS